MKRSVFTGAIRRRIIILLCLFALVWASGGCGGSSSKTSSKAYRVGRTSFDWTDSSRTEKYGPNPGGSRKIVAYVWYPASPAQNATPGPLISDSQATVLSPLTGLPKETLLSLPSKSYINAPPVTNGASFPVLVMSHGNGVAPLLYSNTAEYLASRGYMVVGISHTYNAAWTVFSDNSVALQDAAADPSSVTSMVTGSSSFADYADNWANVAALDADITNDLPFALDQLAALNRADGVFKGRLRLDQVGMFGHSFGGSHAFRMLKEDSRVLAAADVDGTLFNLDFATGAAKPLLILSSVRPSAAENTAAREALLAAGLDSVQANAVMAERDSDRIAFQNSPSAYYVKLTKAQHSNFTDFGLFAAYGLPQDDISATASAETLLNTSNEYLAGFFDEKLRGLYAPILHQSPRSADVIFEKRP